MKFSASLVLAPGTLIILSTGCTDSTQPVEPPANPPVEAPAHPPAPPLPAGISGVYERTDSDCSTLASHYVLYDDKTFALQYANGGYNSFEYPGRYSRNDSLITFNFNNPGAPESWEATGTLRGDSLSVRYNLDMILSDFCDGVYVRSR